MNTVSATTPAAQVAAARYTQQSDRVATGKASKGPVVTAAIVSLLFGLVIGMFIMRQRYRGQEMVVAVNGSGIDKTEFFRRLENSGGDAMIRQMVGEVLYFQFAHKVHKTPSDKDVDAKLQELMNQPDFEAKLEASHLDVEDIRRKIRTDLARQRVLTRDVSVTSADVKRFYDRNIDPTNPDALYYTPDAAQIAVIVSPTLEASEKVVQAIHNGVPFEHAAAIYSTDQPSRGNGGILPAILRGRTTKKSYPGLEQAIFSLKIGQQSEPIKVGQTWWLIKCLDRQPASTQAFQQVKEQATLGAQLSKLSTANRDQLESEFADFQKHSTIQAFWTRYTKAVDLNPQP